MSDLSSCVDMLSMRDGEGALTKEARDGNILNDSRGSCDPDSGHSGVWGLRSFPTD